MCAGRIANALSKSQSAGQYVHQDTRPPAAWGQRDHPPAHTELGLVTAEWAPSVAGDHRGADTVVSLREDPNETLRGAPQPFRWAAACTLH